MLSRRSVLTGLIAAPAIVSFGSIMPVRGEVIKPERGIVRGTMYLDPDLPGSFTRFQNTPYYERMGLGVELGGPDYVTQQIMEFREMPGHVMGPDLRQWGNWNGKFQDIHDEHLRQQIREAIHATRLKNQT